MKYRISAPNAIRTDIKLPSSKSISNRALVISAMAGNYGQLDNLSDCDDTDVIIRALNDMPEVIDIKAAGTAMRFLTAYLSALPGETHVLTGTERMTHRPIRILVDALRRLGAQIEYLGEDGYPPLRITGKELAGGKLSIPGNVSSQYISALMMIGPVMQEGLTLMLEGNIVSHPYIDLTLCTMRDFGAEADWTGVDTITVKPRKYIPIPYYIESDWSASSYWYQMMAMYCNEDCRINLQGVMDGSRQGDSQVKYMFSMLGVKTKFAVTEKLVPTTATLTCHDRTLPRMDFDFTHQPDLAQTLIATCCACNLHFYFRGLASLKIKETDRIEAMKTEMRKLGFVLYDFNDSELRWDGERCEREADAVIETYDDHRMAMAIAPMSIILGPMTINHPEVVSKSYPHFWDDLVKAGFRIEEVR
ncbi:MAG: 3-phosphoshikimate 1-carboxyvinyltransferase [Bacteroidales bacterium]|nr:3-phosphoshikimate 1-carboxyvinyltransferase [Bacteroidales bacterium]MCM1147060.1 3-phosphoshikimate 1-carboxyvinyltransferase [Bacteroidales bacterium]MCM1205807.1 3-phosphoshikimate 1-carboxyvinyltransferase [Bacillota bacterium]MCM1509950.1 3-phosphoshikimate 1-carboxyvinyltransferase [Clostridium sp.]